MCRLNFKNKDQTLNFFLLFSLYSLFHASRKPLTIARTQIDFNKDFRDDFAKRLSQYFNLSPFVLIDGAYNLSYALMMIISYF